MTLPSRTGYRHPSGHSHHLARPTEDREALIAGLLEARAEAQRSVDICRDFESLGVCNGPANDRMWRRFERHVTAIDAAIAFIRGRT